MVKGCAGAGGVDLLPGGLRCRAEWGSVVGDLVAVPVRGDDDGGTPPGRPLLRVLGLRAERACPRRAVGERAGEYGVGAGFDQFESA